MQENLKEVTVPATRTLFALSLVFAPTVLWAQSNGSAAQIHLTGVTAYDSVELLTFAGHLTVQSTGQADPAVVARFVEQIYREDGHFLAVATVAADGQTIVVDEGAITQVSIEGMDQATYRLVRSYMQPLVGRKAVTAAELERAVMLADDIEEIAVTSEIDWPEGSQGARLRVIASPAASQSGQVTLDNPARGFGDAAALSFAQEWYGAGSAGDMLRLGLSVTNEFDRGDLSAMGSVTYRFPLQTSGAYLEGYVSNLWAHRDAFGALQETDIEGRTAILAYGYPVLRDVGTYGYAMLELRHSSTDVDVAGTVFESAVTVAGASWLHGWTVGNGGALEYGVNLSVGERTSNHALDDGDANFWHIRAGVDYEAPAFGNPNLSLRANVIAQVTPSRLPSIDEFYLGGRENLRGYRFAEARGDSGISASVELGRDFFPEGGPASRLRPFGFFDAGYVRNNAPGPTERKEDTLVSAGIGVEADFRSGFGLRAHVGQPLRDGPSTDAGDPALYLALTRSW